MFSKQDLIALYIVIQESKNLLNKKQANDFKDYESFYNVKILIIFNRQLQLKDTESVTKSKVTNLLTQLKGFTFVATLVLVSKTKESDGQSKYDTFYSHSVETKIDESESDEKKYVKNVKNIDDNEWFKWCLVKYLHPSDLNPGRIRKSDKDFSKILDFKDIKFLNKKIETHTNLKKKMLVSMSVFGYEKKKITQSMYQKMCCEDKQVDLFLIGEEDKIHYSLIKGLHTFMFDHTLHQRRKHFCCYCLQAFSLEDILKCQIEDCFK